MTFIELAKAAWPGISDADADYLLWNCTPFPFETNPRILFKRIAGARRAAARGLRLCDFCHRPAVGDGWCCASCEAALEAGR